MKTYFKIKRFILSIILKFYKNKCKTKSNQIQKRGIEAYADYTPEFIFDSLLESTVKTPVIKLKTKKYLKKYKVKLPFSPVVKAPTIYFQTVIDPLISKLPILNTEFQKLGRNHRLIVKHKRSGAHLQIKKKQYQPEKHELIKIIPNGNTKP